MCPEGPGDERYYHPSPSHTNLTLPMHLFTPLDLYGQEEEMTEVTTSARPIVTAPSLDLMNKLAKLRESLVSRDCLQVRRLRDGQVFHTHAGGDEDSDC